MKLELREICTRFKDAVVKDFDKQLKELKDKQPPYEYNRVKHKVNQRYYNWILGYADEFGNRYTHAQSIESRGKVKRLLIDHMVRLTNNKAIGLWLEKGESNLWERIVWDMYDIDGVHYSRVLYRFTYAVICQYLNKWNQIFIVNWGKEEGGDMYKTLEAQLIQCLKVKECPYWSTTEE